MDNQELVQLRDELGCVDSMVLVLILEEIRELCRLRDELVCVLDDIVVVLQILEANQELDQLRDDADELVLPIMAASQKVGVEVLEDRVLVVGEGFGVRLVQQAKNTICVGLIMPTGHTRCEQQYLAMLLVWLN